MGNRLSDLAMRQFNEYLLDGMHPVKGLPAEGFDRGERASHWIIWVEQSLCSTGFWNDGNGPIPSQLGFPQRELAVHGCLLADRLCALCGRMGLPTFARHLLA